MFRAVLLACVAMVATAAPVQLNSQADTPLVRTKRSEEAIMFGNHQNFARMKKGDPHPKPFNSLADSEDVAARPSADTEQNQPEPASNDEQLQEAEGAAQKGKSSQLDEEEQIEKLLTNPDAQVDPLTASADKAEEERILEQLMEDEKHPGAAHSNVPSEGLPIAHPDKVLEEEDPTLEEEEEEEASGEADSNNLQQNDEYKDYIQQPYYYEKNKNARDYEADRLLFPPSLLKSYREKRSLAKSRESRSLPEVATAEDMMSEGPSPAEGAISKKLTGRVKRGLPISPAELEEILARDYYGDERMPEEDYYGDDNIYPMDTENEIPEEPPMVERRGYDDQWEGYEDGPVLDIDPRSEDDGMYLPPEDADAVAENEIDPEERRRLQLLEYLYNTNQGPAYGGEDDDQGPGYPGDFEESWHDLGPAREVMQYEPEPYYGGDDEQEQDFEMAPSKRQYLSLVPGNKRADFYPYQYGPDGRWGAMVPDPDMEKRNEMAEYERLYELAQALNGPDEPAGGSYDKRFEYEEPAYYQGYDRRRK